MKSFCYVIKDEIGLHARPAGMVAKAAKDLDAAVSISCNGKTVDATRLMALIGLGVKHGNEVTVTVEGGDEEAAYTTMKELFQENI